MAFKFVYLKEEDLNNAVRILAEGEASFVVKSAEECKSKASGLNQLKLSLLVTDRTGEKSLLWEYLPGTENMAWKIRKFLRAIGCGNFYNSKGILEPIFLINKSGNCILKTQPSENPEYGPKTIIDKYLEKEGFEHESKNQQVDEDDDVPF